MTEDFARVRDGRLWYERSGEGFPVVLLHPGLWDSRIWEDQFQEFAKHHDVIRYDTRGHGRSDPPSGPYSDLHDLHDLLVELHVDRCALVGCATGAQLAIDFALEHPGMADAVIAIAPGLSGYRWRDPGLENLAETVRVSIESGDLAGAVDTELAVWAPHSSQADPRVREIALDNAGVLGRADVAEEDAPPAVDRIGELHAALMIVVGDRDLGEVHAIADLIVAKVPGAAKREVAGADQLVNVSKPDKFNRMALDFLAFRG
jgi:pimeloyl-ACP methyl ester carboxylesterase